MKSSSTNHCQAHHAANRQHGWRLQRACAVLMLKCVASLLLLASVLIGKQATGQAISFPSPDVQSSISIAGRQITRWQAGNFEVLHIDGDVQIRQQGISAIASEAIVWVEIPPAKPDPFGPGSLQTPPNRIVVYLEDKVIIEIDRGQTPTGQPDRIYDQQWIGQLATRATVDLAVVANSLPRREPFPKIYQRALSQADQTGFRAVLQSTTSGQSDAGITRPNSQPFSLPSASRPPLTNSDTNSGRSGLPISSAPRLVSAQTGEIIQPPPRESLPSINDVPDLGVSPSDIPPLGGLPPGSNDSLPSVSSSPFAGQAPAQDNGGFGNNAGQSALGNGKLNFTPRDSQSSLNFKSFINPQRDQERVTLLVGGIRIVINSSSIANAPAFQGDQDENVIILADSVVHWQQTLPDGTDLNELYLEGNVVFSKDQRVIKSDRMYYSVERQQGTILDAEILTPVPEYRGLIRLKADVIRQVDQNNLQAFGTAFTSSRLGVPSYWLQSRQLNLSARDVQKIDPQTGRLLIDRSTGQPEIGKEYFAESTANRIYIGEVPVFAWPRFTTNLTDPSLYLTQFSISNDQIFGTQIHTGWDLYKVLGLRTPPPGTRWTGILDYLSERGIGYGNEFDYRTQGLFGIPGEVFGKYESWFITDQGLDFLGSDRVDLVPEESFRGRIVGSHRHNFAPGFSLRAEIGYITDRNFLEQFFEREWDTEKDATTGFWLERNFGTQSYNLTADIQVNDFFTQTTWLPRFDQFTIGQPIFGDRAIIHGHTHAGYARLRAANAPEDPTDLATFDLLAAEADLDGVRVGTRQEIDFPLQLGPTKVVPYALGDLTYWQEALDGNDLLRAGGQVGLRASLPVWKVDPTVQSVLFNLNGLAHKVSFDLDAFYADASQSLDELPTLDAIDDDAQEAFRRRFAFNTFGIIAGEDTPLQFDERFFALRQGLQSNVTSPSAEIFDDLSIVKLGVRQRWQTKRGTPGRQRIVDVASLDVQGSFFPDADRDNFGSNFGVVSYDFRWHIGDRLAFVSDGYADTFSQGLRTVSIGATTQRPEVGDLFIGLRSIEGPISSNILTAIGTYRLSDKWGIKGGGQIDFGDTGSIGQQLGVVHIGESFLLELAVNYDANRDNVGIRFGFEPRFLPKPRLFRPGGVAIAPAGARYLE